MEIQLFTGFNLAHNTNISQPQKKERNIMPVIWIELNFRNKIYQNNNYYYG